MPNLLDDQQIDSARYLDGVEKAIYFKRFVNRPFAPTNLYRLGRIGGTNGKANTAIRRWGQCTEVVDGQVDHSWHFVAILHFERNKQNGAIREAEGQLRKFIRNQDNANHYGYEYHPTSKGKKYKDYFWFSKKRSAADAEKAAKKLFSDAIKFILKKAP